MKQYLTVSVYIFEALIVCMRYNHYIAVYGLFPGEPNNYVSSSVAEDCGEMVSAWGYQWNDKRCSIESLYICKKTGILVDRAALQNLMPDIWGQLIKVSFA